jgi:glutathione S-transferase
VLKVLGRTTSLNVRKVLWAADELGLAYAREDWGLPLRDPKTPEFLALNPNAQVPVILQDDLVLWESGAILVHLAEQGGALLPVCGFERPLVLQWLGWQATELNPAWSYAFAALVRRLPGHDDQARLDAGLAAWTAKMSILEAALADGRGFIVGEALSIADIALGLSVHRWLVTPFDRPAMPACEAYHRCLAGLTKGGRWLDPAAYD